MGAHAERMRAQERGGYGRGKLYHFTKEQIEQYKRGWSRMMIDIWREKIIQLNITDSGAHEEQVAAVTMGEALADTGSHKEAVL